MLVKNVKKFCDAHFYYADCLEKQAYDDNVNIYACSCAHSIDEWNIQKSMKNSNPNSVCSFGLHPQSGEYIDIEKNLSFLEKLLINGEVKVLGETGFDYFTDDFKNQNDKQEKMFIKQLELAEKYNVPVVIHCRKANEKLFEYSGELKKLPSVLFHSFMGTSSEALSLLNKNINGYFSFGKQMMNNNKKVISCVKELPLEKLLCETDAPYQFLKGETKTKNSQIKEIYSAFISLRNEDESIIFDQLFENFNAMFCIT